MQRGASQTGASPALVSRRMPLEALEPLVKLADRLLEQDDASKRRLRCRLRVLRVDEVEAFQ